MKLEFTHTGDVHTFVMAMLQGRSFSLKQEGRSLRVTPKFEKGGLSIKKANVNSEMIMTMPVSLPEWGGDAMMTFQYNIESVVLSPFVPPINEVPGITVIGVPADDILEWGSESVGEMAGIRLDARKGGLEPIVEGVLVGAQVFSGVGGLPKVLGIPEVSATQFTCGYTGYRDRGLLIKFE